jgi:hypothetical protein
VGFLIGFCLRRSTLTRWGTPLAPLQSWRVASPTPQIKTKAGFINSMSHSLPKYYFQDIHPDVMEEIMHGMQGALPEPSLEDLDRWLESNMASTESWLKHPKFFIS